jgi:small-conductance mechanosensitive channel
MMNALYFVVAGLALFYFFRLLFRILRAASGKNILEKWVLKTAPFVEMLAWVAYVFWGAAVIFGGYRYYETVVGTMAVVLVLAIAWFVFRDFLTGVLLRADTGFEVGKSIKTSLVEGKIVRLGYRSMELMNATGEKVSIPYSSLGNQAITIPPDEDQQMPHQCRLELSEETDPLRLRAQVADLMMTMPWVAEPAPAISIERDADGSRFMLVRYHTHAAIHAPGVERRLKQLLKQENL